MNLPQRFIIIGGVTIPLHSAHRLSQTITPISEGKHLFRLMGGKLKKQTHWSASKTVITGEGVAPPGLNGIDYNENYQIHCVKQMSSSASEPVFTPNRLFRMDLVPTIHAHFDNNLINLPVSISSGIISATPNGADFYKVAWYPILTVLSDEPDEVLDLNDDVTGWSITAEEVESVT